MWVKSHRGITGNGNADKEAKLGAQMSILHPPTLTEGGLRQWDRQVRGAARGGERAGFGNGEVMNWGRKAVTTFSHENKQGKTRELNVQDREG